MADRSANTSTHSAAEFARIEAALASACTLALSGLLVMHVGAGYHWGRQAWWQTIMVLLFIATLSSLRWTVGRRLLWSASLLAVFAALHVVDLVAEFRTPPQAYSLARSGRVVDSRSQADVLDEERVNGRYVLPALMPAGVFQMKHRDFSLNGVAATPLSSFSSVRTVFCNESGPWLSYDADEHGFNNPPGLWNAPMQIGVVGDSFTHGVCVPTESTIPGLLRRRVPGTFNLGMGGNGPILELATIKEYLVPHRPPLVLQLYFENDAENLIQEWSNTTLRPYLDVRDHRVGLLENQSAVDGWLRRVLDAENPNLLRWPGRLASAGVTRTRTPLWVQDVVDAGNLTLLVRWFRLEKLYERLTGMVERSPGAGSTMEAPPVDLLVRALREARSTVEEWGGRYYLVYVPSYSVLTGATASLRVRDNTLNAARQAGVETIDLYPTFAREPRAEQLYFTYPHSHFSAEGHRAAAEAIASRLERDGRLH